MNLKLYHSIDNYFGRRRMRRRRRGISKSKIKMIT